MAIQFKLGTPVPLPTPAPPLPDITTAMLQRWTFDGLGLADGTPVASVPSAGGSRNVALADPHATVTRRPTITIDAQHGHDALTFDGAQQQYLRTVPLYPTEQRTQQPATKVVVFRRSATTGGLLMSGGVDGVGKGMSVEVTSTSLARMSAVDGGASIASSAPYDTGWHVLVAVFDGANSRIHIDGTVNTGTVTAAPNGLDPRDTIGTNVAATASFFSGQVLEVRIYGRALNPTDAEALIASLSQHYGL